MENADALLYLIQDRKLNLETIEHFNLGVSEDGLLAMPITKNKELIDFKFRTLPPAEKAFIRFQGAETWVFNEEGFDIAKESNEIIVCEGEIDAMSVWQAGFTNVISLVGGAQSIGTWLQGVLEVDKVYILLDSDDAGQKGARKLAERIGLERCINVKLPVKDANDFFKQYTSEDFKNVIKNSEKFPIQDVARLQDLVDSVREKQSGEKDFKFYYLKLDEITGGFNRSNVIVLSADSSHGKSTMAVNICSNLCKHDIPALYVPLEDNPNFLARRMCNTIIGAEVSTLKDDAEWTALKDRVRNFPFYLYMARSKFNLDVFKNIIEVGKKVYNIEVFVLDHLHFLTSRSSDITAEVGFLVREVVELARMFNVSIILISHIRKKTGSGQRTTMPDANELRDSGLIKGDAHMVLMMLRKFDKELGYTIDLEVQKNREGNITQFPISFSFDMVAGIIKEGTVNPYKDKVTVKED